MQGVTLMAFDEKSMSIQINFAKPDYISQSISDADVLEVEVLAANLFVDQIDYEQLAGGTKISQMLPPQMT